MAIALLCRVERKEADLWLPLLKETMPHEPLLGPNPARAHFHAATAATLSFRPYEDAEPGMLIKRGEAPRAVNASPLAHFGLLVPWFINSGCILAHSAQRAFCIIFSCVIALHVAIS